MLINMKFENRSFACQIEDTKAVVDSDNKGVVRDYIGELIDNVVDWLNPETSEDRLNQLQMRIGDLPRSYQMAFDRIVREVSYINDTLLSPPVNNDRSLATDGEHHLGLLTEHIDSAAAWRDITARYANQAQAFAQGQLSPEAANLAATARDYSQMFGDLVDTSMPEWQRLHDLLMERGFNVGYAAAYHASKPYGIGLT